jgi:putative ABC transport system permease protein
MRLKNFAMGRQSDQRLREEMEEHLAQQTEENLRAGMAPQEARRQAVLKFGAVQTVREDYHSEQGLPFIESLLQDVRYAMRLFVKSPGFATVAILTMALGIGATTAIFSVVDATLLHPLSYPHPEQLVRIEDDLPGLSTRDAGISVPEWKDLEHSGIFEYVSPSWYDDNNLVGGSMAERVRLLTVAPNYFALLAVKPQMGRWFDPNDPSPDYNQEVLISDGLWKREFGGDRRILERSIWLDTDLYRIVGVMPRDFRAPGPTEEERETEVWAAAGLRSPYFLNSPARARRDIPGAIARLRPGLTIAEAQSRVDALVEELQKEYPVDYPLETRWTVHLTPLKENVVGNVRQPLMLLLGAVGLLLLIGSVNVANLMLARAGARGREIAVRQALGAAPARLMRQMLTESLLLSLLGGIAGLVILFCTKGLLVRLVPDSLPRLNDISIHWGVLLFALAASLAAGLIFGLAPALDAGQLNLMQVLRQEGRSSTGSGDKARARQALVVTEFALSLMLLIAASLLLRSFWDLANERLGFNPENAMTVHTRLPYPNVRENDRYRTITQVAPFVREVLRRSHTLPGVEEAAMGDTMALPLERQRRVQGAFPLIQEGKSHAGAATPLIDGAIVTPGYFHLMGMTRLRGRIFSDSDNEDAPAAAVINEAAAQMYWPGENPLGKHLKLDRQDTSWTTVVGVIANARTISVSSTAVPQVYVSLFQKHEKHLVVFLRGHLDTGAIPDQLRGQIQSVDPTIPVFGAKTLDQMLSDSLAVRRFTMEMVALFAGAALLLSGLGIYGTISYLVSERTQEIGIRLALGARRGDISRMVLRQGLRMAIAGTAVGLVGSLIVSRLMAGLLYGVRPTDPATFVGVAIFLVGIALLACYLPARRAMRVDPMIALRYE